MNILVDNPDSAHRMSARRAFILQRGSTLPKRHASLDECQKLLRRSDLRLQSTNQLRFSKAVLHDTDLAAVVEKVCN